MLPPALPLVLRRIRKGGAIASRSGSNEAFRVDDSPYPGVSHPSRHAPLAFRLARASLGAPPRGTVIGGALLDVADEFRNKEITALAAITEPYKWSNNSAKLKRSRF